MLLVIRCAAGIANDKAVDISEGAEGGMHISMKRLKTAQKPTEATTKVTSKKHARRAIAAARKQVASYRKDLQVGAACYAIVVAFSYMCTGGVQYTAGWGYETAHGLGGGCSTM